jgi:carboxypeptidase Q
VIAADLMQNAAIVASFVYHAAMRDGLLPRKPLPRYEGTPASAAPAPSPSPSPRP